jgi:hypothetical protein
MKTSALLLVSCLLLAACASEPPAKPKAAAAFGDEVTGLKHNDIVLRYGPPERITQEKNGEYVMQYKRSRVAVQQDGKKKTFTCDLRIILQGDTVQKTTRKESPSNNGECQRFLESGKTAVYEDTSTASTAEQPVAPWRF